MAIKKKNLINGEKPEFGNVDHIKFCKRLNLSILKYNL